MIYDAYQIFKSERRRVIYTLVLVAVTAIVAYLIYTLIRLGKNDYRFLADRMAQKSRQSLEVLKPCPLCGSLLRRGETVRTVVYSGDGSRKVEDQEVGADSVERNSPNRIQDALVHMLGCKYCYPANEEHPRTCPVCQRTVPDDGYVVARMFERQGRKHVHVTGCTQCRRRRR